MRNLFLGVFIFAFLVANSSFASGYEDLVAQKRAEAERKRTESLQRVQNIQQNPQAYMISKNNPQTSTGGAEEFKVSGDGHYYIPVSINNRNLQFMADTGATGIFISQTDARAVGINPTTLNYDQSYTTANGAQGRAAIATAKTLKVGSIQMTNVPVVVSMQANHMALLGMEFFGRLKRYEVAGGVMSLHK